jgi:hypothetical protein
MHKLGMRSICYSIKTSFFVLTITTLLMLFTLLTPSITTTSYAQTGSTAALETIQSTYAVSIVTGAAQRASSDVWPIQG